MKKLLVFYPKTLIVGAIAILFCPLLSYGQTILELRDNWYFAAAGDIAWHNNVKFEGFGGEFAKYDYDIGQGISVSVGKACRCWRMEFEAAYRKSNLDTITSIFLSEDATGFIRDFTLMLNAYWDVYIPNSFWIFYLGGGFGVSFNEKQDASTDTDLKTKSNTIAAWQGMSGISYELRKHVFVSAGYRIFMTSKIRSLSGIRSNDIVIINNIEIGVRIEL